MPWSAKAREPIQRRYARVGTAVVASLEACHQARRTKPGRGGLCADLADHLWSGIHCQRSTTKAAFARPLGKRSLGIEALERVVAREPLRRVHECVFGVLALESE